MKKVFFFLLMITACYSFAETPEAGKKEAAGNHYYICLGSFTVPANAARYQLDLAGTGVETLTENVQVRGRWFTRVLYRPSFIEELRAHRKLNTLSDNRIIRVNNIRDLWVRSSTAPLEDDPAFLESSSFIAQEVPLPESFSDEKSPPKVSREKPPPAEEFAEAGKPAPKPEAVQEGNTYRTIHPEGYANCIFAADPIALGQEEEYELQEKFVYPEPVYARCYLPGPIGEIKGEDFWHEIWIDGKLKGRTFFKEPPEPSWDQIQIWITEDEYSRQMEELGSGEHTVIIWVMKNEFQGERAVADVNAAGEITAEMKEIWVPVRLSKGTFTYVVP